MEDKFGGYKANRMEIAHGLRYAYLSDAFDREVYSAILEEAPMEAHGITRKFSPDDIVIGSLE